jgi:hypothetical protein
MRWRPSCDETAGKNPSGILNVSSGGLIASPQDMRPRIHSSDGRGSCSFVANDRNIVGFIITHAAPLELGRASAPPIPMRSNAIPLWMIVP